jgi:hypothetical protein
MVEADSAAEADSTVAEAVGTWAAEVVGTDNG